MASYFLKNIIGSFLILLITITFFGFGAENAMADDAEFIGENIRDNSYVFYGEKFTKKWTFKNISSTTWTTNYRWQFVPDENAQNSIAKYNCYCLKNEVSPGSEYSIEVPMLVPNYGVDNKDIQENWRLVDEQGNDVLGASGWMKVKAVNCPVSNSFTYPVGYEVKNVTKHPYWVSYDFVDKHYVDYGWHQSEDWNGRANGAGDNDEGDPVYSIGYGCVVFSGWINSLGNVVLIRHVRQLQNEDHEPIYSRYLHLKESFVNVGDVVYRGEIIAELGRTGGKWYAHLDFGIMKDAIFTVESLTSICKIKDPNAECIFKQPQTYAAAAGNWVSNKDTRTEERKQWILNNYYNPYDYTVNTASDDAGNYKILPEFDKGDIFFPGNQDIIVDDKDDQDVGFTKIGENWDPFKDDDFSHYYKFPANAEGYSAKWTPNIPQTGYYDVFAGFWCSPDEPDIVVYTVYDSNGGHTVGIDQSQHNQTGKYIWYEVYLGTYHFLQGNEHGYVNIENAPDANVDQMFFRPVDIYKPPEVINISAALIIDSSGSMKWNDLFDMRKQAAKIFVDAAHDNDSIAIIDFDSDAYAPWHLKTLTSNRSGIKFAIDMIDSSGGTDIRNGLTAGFSELAVCSIHAREKKAAVLLTDGVGYYSGEADLYRNLITGEIWPIYTIGLGYDTNPELLKEIANKTCGKYFELTDPNQLQSVYFEIAAQISGGNVLASESSVMSTGDTFSASVAIPAGQQSATFLTTWPGSDVNTTLTAPNGTEITPATSDPNIYYAKGLTYELYRISNPEAGNWTANLYGTNLAPQGETVNISVSSVGLPVPEDTTPPVITISNPIDGKTYFDQVPTTFSFAVDDPETAVTSQTTLLNGSPINNNDNILLTQLGENVLTITATNEANLTSELSITFYVNHFSWLPPIKYEKGSATQTITYVALANSTLPIKFAIFNADDSFIADNSVKVIVEGTTAQFLNGEGDTNIRINQEEGEDPLYIVNLHTNFNKCDYGLEAGNEYNLTIYFNNILAASTKLRIE